MPSATQAQGSKSEEIALNNLRSIIQQLTNRQPETPHDILAEAALLMKILPAENARMKQQLNKTGITSGGTVVSGGTGTGTHNTKPSSLL